MTRLWLLPLVCAIIMASAAPATTAAKAMPGPLAPEDVQAAFRRAGYGVGEVTSWSNGARMFAVRRPEANASDRPLLLAFVFVDVDAAAAEYVRAYAYHEAGRSRAIVASGDRGPRLLTGYGASAWRRNVAIVQASSTEDVGAFPVEPDCAPTPFITDTTGAELASRDFALPATVDPRFVELLDSLSP